jgi:hypothetical protein
MPWYPGSHMLYGPRFRRAVFATLLVAQRLEHNALLLAGQTVDEHRSAADKVALHGGHSPSLASAGDSKSTTQSLPLSDADVAHDGTSATHALSSPSESEALLPAGPPSLDLPSSLTPDPSLPPPLPGELWLHILSFIRRRDFAPI